MRAAPMGERQSAHTHSYQPKGAGFGHRDLRARPVVFASPVRKFGTRPGAFDGPLPPIGIVLVRNLASNETLDAPTGKGVARATRCVAALVAVAIHAIKPEVAWKAIRHPCRCIHDQAATLL